MVKAKTDVGSRADGRRAEILAIAEEVFSVRGYRATSMSDLAAAAGMGKPTLYHYFTSKQELLTTLYERVIDESVASARSVVPRNASPREKLRALIVDRIEYNCNHKGLLTIFFEEEAELPLALARSIVKRRRTYEQIFTDIIEAALAPGTSTIVSPQIYVYTILGASNWVYKWYDPAGSKTATEVANEMAELLLAPMGG